MKSQTPKFVGNMKDWARVAGELSGEDLKQKIYDNSLLSSFGEVKGKRVLDYGTGPAVIAKRLADSGAEVKAFDISPEMLRIAAEKLGSDSVFDEIGKIPKDYFDVILCNLVLCIVPEDEVARIARNIRDALAKDGFAYIGLCNPRIFDLPESIIDFRLPAGRTYFENHEYEKVKKEGGYKIVELHRPIEWYAGLFKGAGLELVETIFTPEYEASGRKVHDFVIFKLRKEVSA
ncbi:class I SAM-dependent methyltransferase [Candidatus Micrarchaeota archaeon]|nr:class I SAM-dependent methyltransferase [Candidatus Micrarchaeota archaeon]